MNVCYYRVETREFSRRNATGFFFCLFLNKEWTFRYSFMRKKSYNVIMEQNKEEVWDEKKH